MSSFVSAAAGRREQRGQRRADAAGQQALPRPAARDEPEILGHARPDVGEPRRLARVDFLAPAFLPYIGQVGQDLALVAQCVRLHVL